MSEIKVTGGNMPFSVEVVNTKELLEQGLSGRRYLDMNHGMLFVFPSEGIKRMWMPNMYFPLDIVWLNSSKKIVKIDVNVQACSGTHNCKTYSSDIPVLYAIELNGNNASTLGLHVNQQLSF